MSEKVLTDQFIKDDTKEFQVMLKNIDKNINWQKVSLDPNHSALYGNKLFKIE